MVGGVQNPDGVRVVAVGQEPQMPKTGASFSNTLSNSSCFFFPKRLALFYHPWETLYELNAHITIWIFQHGSMGLYFSWKSDSPLPVDSIPLTRFNLHASTFVNSVSFHNFFCLTNFLQSRQLRPIFISIQGCIFYTEILYPPSYFKKLYSLPFRVKFLKHLIVDSGKNGYF